jgi:hypothetical protein
MRSRQKKFSHFFTLARKMSSGVFLELPPFRQASKTANSGKNPAFFVLNPLSHLAR